MLGGIRFFSLLVAGVLPGAALACACCAEHGARFSHVIELGSYELGELASLKPAGPARLFLTACGFDCVRGISAPQESYAVSIAVSEAGIDFDLSTPAGGDVGRVSFDWPPEYAFFGADTDLADEGRSPEIYTEMRFAGAVSGDGDFQSVAGVPAELVFSGYGNMCLSRHSFSGWTLSVTGADAEYRLFGSLGP